MKHLKHLALALSLLILPACDPTTMTLPSYIAPQTADSFIGYDNCPRIEIVNELDVLSDFGNAMEATPSNLSSHVALSKIESSCSYKDKSVTLDLKLAFEANLGPKGRSHSIEKPFFAYPYFVAITNPSGDIIAKEVFAAPMTFALDKTEMTYYEGLRQIIPINHKQAGPRYKVLLGFQLTENQLAYNRNQIAKAKAKEEEALAAKAAAIALEKANKKAAAQAEKAAEQAKKDAAIAADAAAQNAARKAAKAKAAKTTSTPINIVPNHE